MVAGQWFLGGRSDSNVSEPVPDDVATFTKILTAPEADLLLLRLTNDWGCLTTFRQTQRWNGGEEARFSFRTSVFRYRNGPEAPAEERTSGLFLSVAPRLEAPSSGCDNWRVTLGLRLTEVGRPSSETPASADGVYPERPFVPVRGLDTSVDIYPGSVVCFRAGDGTTRSPLVVLECTPAAPLPEAPAVPPPAAPAIPEGFAHRLYSVPWMEQHSVFPYLVPTNAPASSGEAVLALARELGADIPDGSTARYLPEICKLVVTTTPAALAEIEQLLGALLGSPSGERVEVAASVLAVANADLDSFLDRFGVTNTTAARLAPVLARRPSLDDLRDLAKSPPAADLAPSFGDDHLRMKPDGIARRTVGNDECAELASITEYIFASTFRWGGTDVPASDGGAVSNRAVIIRDPQDFQTRPVGPQFRVVPRLRPGDARIHLAVRFEYTGHPVWAWIPSAGVPLRRADGSYAMVRSGYVEGNPPWFCGGEMPEFPSFVEECALDLADGEAALLRPFPDPNAPADAPRVFVPVVSARRIPDPVEALRRTPGSRQLASPEAIARRREIIRKEPDVREPPVRAVDVAPPADPAAAAARRDAAARFGARVDATVRVVLDDPGTPAAGARVVWRSDGPAGALAIEAVAGTDGVARVQGVSFGRARIEVEAPGAYPATAAVALDLPEGADAWVAKPAHGGPWLSHGGLRLRLRSVRAPHAMARSELPAVGNLPPARAGFDAEKGAFLPPWGEGETADFFVEGGRVPCRWPAPDFDWLVVWPAPDGGALREMPDRGDALRLPRRAPDEGWSEEPLRFFSAAGGSSAFLPATLCPASDGATAPRREKPSGEGPREAPPAGAILFRSRVRRGADGAAGSVRYGAILPAAQSPFANHPSVLFNTTDNERSLEPEALP
ncbi:MAG: hypothetical protein IJV65_04665 [Kiritimatiellae bacterium]|nr:hypothetical protein [Kiritimatiellia bacterium]